MPAARVIMALTLINAMHASLGRSASWALYEPGKLADIRVIRGNPLFDIVAVSNVDVVVKDGVPYREAARIGPSLSAR